MFSFSQSLFTNIDKERLSNKLHQYLEFSLKLSWRSVHFFGIYRCERFGESTAAQITDQRPGVLITLFGVQRIRFIPIYEPIYTHRMWSHSSSVMFSCPAFLFASTDYRCHMFPWVVDLRLWFCCMMFYCIRFTK